MKKTFTILLIFAGIIHAAMAQKSYPRGLVFDDEAYEKMPMKAVLTKGSYDNLEKQISYERYCPPVMDQARYQTCVGFASTYYMRSILEKISRKQSPGTAVAFSPSYTYDKIKQISDLECQQGSSLMDALYSLKTAGAPLYEDFPYPNCGTISMELDQQASAHRIGDVIRLFGLLAPAELKIKSLKKALSDGYPVVIGMRTPLSFFATQQVWQPAPGDEHTPLEGTGHALCVIGYDDSKFGGAFRVVNSWGNQWAEEGFCWVRYQDMARYTYHAFQAFPDFNAPVPVAKVENLKGKLNLQLREGSLMPSSQLLQKGLVVSNDHPRDIMMYQLSESYSAGTAFKAFITASESAYVYMIGTDTTFQMNALFPYTAGVSPLLGPHTTVAYPSDNKSITLDQASGTDYLIVLFSRKPLAFSQILQQLQQRSGDLSTRLTAVLKEDLIPGQSIRYQPNEPAFEVKSGASGSVVPLVVAIEHR